MQRTKQADFLSPSPFLDALRRFVCNDWFNFTASSGLGIASRRLFHVVINKYHVSSSPGRLYGAKNTSSPNAHALEILALVAEQAAEAVAEM